MPIQEYLSAVSSNLARGDSTEHTHRPALKALLEALGGKGVVATNEPKRIKCGAPDFRVTRRKIPVGHVETKEVGTNLDQMVKGRGPHGDQFLRYRQGLSNWVLTDYLDFRWYVNGDLRLRARAAEVDGRGRIKPASEGPDSLDQLLDAFLAEQAPTVGTAKDLAERMAGMTRIVRDLISQTLAHEKRSGWLHGWLEAFREVLIPDLDETQFSDMFAQTVAYGLFAARVHAPAERQFSRELAGFNLPKTNPFLRKLFSEIAGVDMPETIAWAVDDLVELLRHANMTSILRDFGKAKGKEDPVVHFYETFLAAYDPTLREVRGVYYTPEPVVSFIVRSVHELLRSDFHCPDGLAESTEHEDEAHSSRRTGPSAHRVLILDPACGTGTFLYAVVDLIRNGFIRRTAASEWGSYVRGHLFPRVFGFELLMAPYAVAHLKLGMQIAGLDLPEEARSEWAYRFKGEDRIGVYLTNSLEEAARRSELLIGRYISEEANAAAEIKRDLPIMVVLGNPPYSGHSANRGEWIRHLVADYSRGIPGLNKPAQAKWLQDDYVKFIRFAQWRIERTGAGILGFITNNRYLANPTFLGMRRRLLEAFTDVYILNLHGDSKRGEVAPDGGRDENVFDIQQGVAIGIFVKRAGGKGPAHLHYVDLWGPRESKYSWLSQEGVNSVSWANVSPEAPFYLFVPESKELRGEYHRAWSLKDAMNRNGDPAPGVVTTQDEFAISFTKGEAIAKINRFLETSSEEEARSIWTLCSQSQWDYKKAKQELALGQWKTQLRRILYRPFDRRWTIWNPHVAVHRRERVMRHMLDETDLGLVTTRAVEIGRGFEHVLCSRLVVQHHTVSIKEVNYLFPLYLRPTEEEIASGLYPADERRLNLAPDFLQEFAAKLGSQLLPQGRGDPPSSVGPEDVFHYIYAVLHSREYRRRYAEFLRSDFPRIPVTSTPALFRELVRRGEELAMLHLMDSGAAKGLVTTFPIPGDNIVASGCPQYCGAGTRDAWSGARLQKGRVYISKPDKKTDERGQYFDGVPPEVWEFHIGGYQVCEKWLRDRRGRALTFEELSDYQRMVVAVKETLRVMDEIDHQIDKYGGWPLDGGAGQTQGSPEDGRLVAERKRRYPASQPGKPLAKS